MGDSSLGREDRPMPWQESCAMHQRIGFINDYNSGSWTMTELCERYQISRKTGYKWLARYRDGGAAGLMERSHAPRRHGRVTPEPLVEAIIALRLERPNWGPRKIVAKLAARQPNVAWPAASTAGDILTRAGLVCGRRLKRRAPPRHTFDAAAIRQSRVARGSQRLGMARRWRAARALDHHGWLQPLPDRGRGHARHHAGGSAVCVRAGLCGARLAGGDPVGQWHAVCGERHDGADAVVGVVDQAGHSARADRSGSSAAEWRARALSSHACGGDAACGGRSGR